MIGSLISPQLHFTIIYGLFLLFSAGQVFACDTDAECGAGGTCIKREKRGRGVCYGGNLGADPQAATTPPNVTSSPSANPGQLQVDNKQSTNSDAPIYGEEGYVEPNAKPRMIDRLDIQEPTNNACVTSTDCSGGQQCVYRDPMLGHGLCETPP